MKEIGLLEAETPQVLCTTLRILHQRTSIFKMAAQRLTIRQKGIRDLLKVLIWGIQKNKHYEN